MSWNYRVVKRVVQDEEIFSIHSAYYDSPADEKPHSISVEPMAPFGTTLEEVKWDTERMLDALKKPVLNYEDIG